jgi:hypothetical protein
LKFLERWGKVDDVQRPSKGYAFVIYKREEDAASAVAIGEFQLISSGKILSVEMASSHEIPEVLPGKDESSRQPRVVMIDLDRGVSSDDLLKGIFIF